MTAGDPATAGTSAGPWWTRSLPAAGVLAALVLGRALAYAQPYPLTFDRLWHWAQGLEAKGIRLVPVSRFLAEP